MVHVHLCASWMGFQEQCNDWLQRQQVRKHTAAASSAVAPLEVRATGKVLNVFALHPPTDSQLLASVTSHQHGQASIARGLLVQGAPRRHKACRHLHPVGPGTQAAHTTPSPALLSSHCACLLGTCRQLAGAAMQPQCVASSQPSCGLSTAALQAHAEHCALTSVTKPRLGLSLVFINT